MDTIFNVKVTSKKYFFLSWKRYIHIFLIGTIISMLSFFILQSKYYLNINHFCFKNYERKNVLDNFTIKTVGCTIPSLRPYDDSVKIYIKYPENIPRCLNSSQVILEHNETHIWIRRELLEIREFRTLVSCCYRSFYRPASIDNIDESVDDRVKYNECVVFEDIINVNHEFVNVNCSIGNIKVEEYFLFAPYKEFKSHSGHKAISKNKTSYYNILVLGIDSVSRLNFYRSMPKTADYLRERSVIDLSGYNKVGDNTFPNLIPMLLGISDEEIKTTCLPQRSSKFDNCPFIWEWFKQAGYYTALAEDSSWLGTFNYLRAGFSNTPTDYYPHTFINEAESYAFQPNGFNTSKLCLNKKYFYQILLDYVENLTSTLKEKRLFGFFWEVTMSHDDLNYPMVMDDDYLKLFQKMDASGYLQDTIVFLLSDHGIRWGEIRYTKQGRLEERLPFVFLLLPTSFRKKYSLAFKNIQLNSKRLTTPYDIHATLLDLINTRKLENEQILDRSKEVYYKNRSISLFLPVPNNRTCALAGISDHWCTCHKSVAISINDRNSVSAAEHLMKHLNTLLKDYSKCMKLELKEIIEAAEMVVGKPEDEEVDSWREFMIVIRTMPGDGVFEATLRGDYNGLTVVGTVGRLNLYGEQSQCIDDNKLKLYCYCKGSD